MKRRRVFLLAIVIVVLAAVTAPLWKRATDRTKWGIIIAHVAHNTSRRLGLVRGQIDDPYAMARADAEIPSTIAGLDSVFKQYRDFARLTPDVVSGAHVLEVGPGNTIGIPLLFIGAGAARAAAIDKFVALQDSPFHRRLYSALRDRFDAAGRARFDAALRIGDRLEPDPQRLSYVSGRGIEEHPFPAASFDIIVSSAVLMEIYDADATFAALDRVLKPGGRMAHFVDLSDYSLFPKRGFHPLEFLTIPDPIYRHMAESIGQPNRRLVNYYRDRMAALGYDATIYITSVTGAPSQLEEFPTRLSPQVHYSVRELEMIRDIRPRLLDRYRQLPDEDLLTAGILLIARKPG